MRSGVGILLGAMLTLVSAFSSGPALAFKHYGDVKRALFNQVFVEQRQTLYCGCPFDAERRPDLKACGYLSPKNSDRAKRIEVDHVVPASWIGQNRPCWHQKICIDGRGRAFKGRKCCLAVDPAFRRAFQDLHNLWPTIGEVNQRRSHFRFGMIDGERRRFGRCDIEINVKARLAEPRPAIRGDIARAGLYMEAVHGVRLRAEQRQLFQSWNRSDPPDGPERRRNDMIKRLQGRSNPWISEPATTNSDHGESRHEPDSDG